MKTVLRSVIYCTLLASGLMGVCATIFEVTISRQNSSTKIPLFLLFIYASLILFPFLMTVYGVLGIIFRVIRSTLLVTKLRYRVIVAFFYFSLIFTIMQISDVDLVELNTYATSISMILILTVCGWPLLARDIWSKNVGD
jgi:hypothetical protein